MQKALSPHPKDMDLIVEKAKIKWLAYEDDNIKFFPIADKDRSARGRTNTQFSKECEILKQEEHIRSEIRRFHLHVQGTRTQFLEGVNEHIIRKEHVLNKEEAEVLSKDESSQEVWEALKSIDNDKYPSMNGSNAVFFY